MADARIDNREELIRALAGEGLPPNPTDADLILAAYRRWREACPERLLGDFVFAVWDAADQKLFLARDALGGRSLATTSTAGDACSPPRWARFSTFPGSARINEDKVADHLASLARTDETLFESIHYCPPAHAVVVSAAGVRKRRYWDVDPAARIRYRDDREYAEHFLELLTSATRCRMRSVGPVGLSLSGGLDSTCWRRWRRSCCRRTGLAQERLKSFSYVFDELKSCDEREYIQPVVDRLGLDATYLPGDDKWTLKDLASWPVERDYIWSDPYVLLPAAVAAAARDAGCRVLLNGHFGDPVHRRALLGCRTGEGGALEGTGPGVAGPPRADRLALGFSGPRPAPACSRRTQANREAPEGTAAAQPSASFHPAMARRVKQRARAIEDSRSRRFTAQGQWVRLTALTDNSWAEGSARSDGTIIATKWRSSRRITTVEWLNS